jgi:hypothetical protein
VAERTAENAKQEAKTKVQDTLDEIKAPGKMQRLKEMMLAQSPYRKQYLQPGTRFYASLTEPLDFGKTSRTAEQLAQLGKSPQPDSILHARFADEVSSATAQRGNVIAAVLTEPLFSQDHHLLLPANSRIAGEVIKAEPARKLHHNGDLRVIFNRIETPEGIIQPMQGSVEGVERRRPTVRRGTCRREQRCYWQLPHRIPIVSTVRRTRRAIQECARVQVCLDRELPER